MGSNLFFYGAQIKKTSYFSKLHSIALPMRSNVVVVGVNVTGLHRYSQYFQMACYRPSEMNEYDFLIANSHTRIAMD